MFLMVGKRDLGVALVPAGQGVCAKERAQTKVLVTYSWLCHRSSHGLGPIFFPSLGQWKTTPDSSTYPLIIHVCLWARPGADAGDMEMKVSACKRVDICRENQTTDSTQESKGKNEIRS